MKEPTVHEVLELVEFERDGDGGLLIKRVLGDVRGDVRGYVKGNVGRDVCGDVCGSVLGDVYGSVLGDVCGDVRGNVDGDINGRKWQSVETPAEKAIRLIREGKGEEAIKVLEEEQ